MGKKQKFEVSEARGLVKRKRTDYRGEMKRRYFIETASQSSNPPSRGTSVNDPIR